MIKRIRTTKLSSALLLALVTALPVFTGCAAVGAAGDGIVFIDGRKMGKKIDVANLQSAATETGTRKVWTTIHN